MAIVNGRIIVVSLRPVIAKNLNNWDMLDLGAGIYTRDTYEHGVGNPVDCYKPTDKAIIFD